MQSSLPTALLIACAATAQAPRNDAWIAADAELVGHLDLAAAQRTPLGRRLLGGAQKVEVDSLDEFARWAERSRLELGRDIAAITAYSTPPEDAPPVVIVTMASAAERLFADPGEEDRYWLKTIDGKAVHSFQSGEQRVYAHIAAVAGDGPRPVLFCNELDRLFDAIAVVEGERPGLAGSGNPIARRALRPSSYLSLVVSDVDKLTAGNPASALLEKSASFALEAGEEEGQFTARLVIRAKDEESSANIAHMAQGLIALARLIASGEDTPADVKEGRLLLLRSIDVTPRERDIEVSFRCAVDRLADLLEKR